MKHLSILVLLGLLLPAPVWARGGGSNIPIAPIGDVFPNVGGILFPGINMAAGINSAALGKYKKANSLQLDYRPALRSGDTHEYLASFATTKNGFGFGFGITGSQYSSNNANGAFVGIGKGFDDFSLGLAVREPDLSQSSPEVDFGLLVNDGSGLTGGLTMYHLNNSARLAAGVGYDGGKKYNLEGTVLLPNFSGFDGDNYITSITANIFVGPLSFYFRTSYYVSSDALEHSLALTIWWSETVNTVVQYNTPNRYTFGLTLQL